MARNKDQTFKLMLGAERKKRMRAPVWTYLKTRRRILPRFRNVHWRRTDLGHRVRRKLGWI